MSIRDEKWVLPTCSECERLKQKIAELERKLKAMKLLALGLKDKLAVKPEPEMVEAIRELRTAFFFIDDPNRHEWIAKVLEKTAKYEEAK